MFLKRFKRWFKESKAKVLGLPMLKNIFIMVTGTGIAQIFPILSAPIITRLYEPVDFGTYAIFYSLVALLSGFIFLDYSNVIIVAKTNQKAYEGMALSLAVSTILSLLLMLGVTVAPNTWLIYLFGAESSKYLWIVPITVFFNALSIILYNWFLRESRYGLLTKNKIILAICSVVLQIGIGLLHIGALGFIIANLAAILISLLLLAYSFWKEKVFVPEPIKFSHIRSTAIEFKNFPLVAVWGNTLNNFTQQIPQFLINKVFGAQILGQYSLAQRMISLPMGFLSTAIQDTFRQGASKENSETESCIKTYMRTLKIALIIGVIILISCLTFVPPLFVFVFGAKWADAGLYVRVLALLFVVRFVVAPLSYTFYIKAKQHIDLLWQVGLFIFSAFTLYGGYYWFKIKDPIALLFFYSVIISIWYGFNLWLTYKIAKGNEVKY